MMTSLGRFTSTIALSIVLATGCSSGGGSYFVTQPDMVSSDMLDAGSSDALTQSDLLQLPDLTPMADVLALPDMILSPDMLTQCSNGIVDKNDGETDVDCGGPVCPKCPDYKICNVGNGNADCQSGCCKLFLGQLGSCTPVDAGMCAP